MISPCLFIDIDSNKSFFQKKILKGQLDPTIAEANLKKLLAHAKKKGIKVISPLESVFLDKKNYEKIEGTLLKNNYLVKQDHKTEKLKAVINQYDQILVEKNNYNVFSNPLLQKLIQESKIKNIIVFGYGIDYGIEGAIVKLRELGYNVWVPVDAVIAINELNREPSVKELHNLGTQIWNTDFIIANT